MSSGYNGLLMGCARNYWLGILKKIYSSFGTQPFEWSQVFKYYPEISNSDMRRLKCSNWFKKHSKNKKIGLWTLPPEAIRLCQGNSYIKTTTKTRQKQQSRPSLKMTHK